jgi:tetratricopeptide (TPR) repeat protein
MTFPTRALFITVFLVLLVGSDGAAPSGKKEAPGKIDADLWARRNIELLRWAVHQPDRSVQSMPGTVVGFTLQFNPLLARDPYAAEVADLTEKFQATAGERAKYLDKYIAALRRPEAERLKRLQPGQAPVEDEGADIQQARPRVYNIGSDILNLRGDARAEREPRLIERMESAAREQQAWGELALAYLRLASFALHDHKPQAANRYIDRMLELLREHPDFQDPNRGNTNAVHPASVAELMLKVDRRADFEQLIEAHRGEARAELAVGLIAALGYRGEFDAARACIERYLRNGEPDRAARLAAALEAKIVLPPPAEDRRKRHEMPPPEARLRGAQGSIASGFAARGDVETAAKMHLALRRDDAYHRAGEGQLDTSDWAGLARNALEHGHTDATRRAFEHAIAAMAEDTSLKEDERQERERLVRQAVSIGNFELVDRILNNGSRPGARARLEVAKTYRKLGDADKARAALDEALAQAYGPDDRAGAAMADAAVELQALGDPQRAEKVLLDSLDRIEGVDFGFGGTAAVVSAAARMNRLDLLDRLYERSEPGTRLLLCITASHAAVYGVEEER